MNRKGTGLSEFWEIILTLLLFVIIVVISIAIVGIDETKVDAKVKAENAAFTCKNDLVTFLMFPTMDGGSFDDLLLDSYVKKDYTKFSSDVKQLFDSLIGSNIWSVTVSDSTQELATVGVTTGKDVETCSTYVPIPCKLGSADCRLKLDLEMMY